VIALAGASTSSALSVALIDRVELSKDSLGISGSRPMMSGSSSADLARAVGLLPNLADAAAPFR
jgi:hypothetical protein